VKTETTAYFQSAEKEWTHMSYEKKILFLRKLRQDSIRRGLNGESWFVKNWQLCAQVEDFDSLPQDLRISLQLSFKTFGSLQSFEL
jgi:hypothetical protein